MSVWYHPGQIRPDFPSLLLGETVRILLRGLFTALECLAGPARVLALSSVPGLILGYALDAASPEWQAGPEAAVILTLALLPLVWKWVPTLREGT
jgi:hypothetical protein